MGLDTIDTAAHFFDYLADWLEENVDHDQGDEFDRKLNDIRLWARDLYAAYDELSWKLNFEN